MKRGAWVILSSVFISMRGEAKRMNLLKEKKGGSSLIRLERGQSITVIKSTSRTFYPREAPIEDGKKEKGEKFSVERKKGSPSWGEGKVASWFIY